MRRPGRGLTLLEILLSLTFLVLGVLAVLELSPLLLQGERLSEQHSLATQYAQFFMEMELKNSYAVEAGLPAALSTAPVPSWPMVSSQLPGVPASPLYRYNVFRTPVVEAFSASPPICVTVQVVWTDPDLKRAATLQTYTLVCYKTTPPGVP